LQTRDQLTIFGTELLFFMESMGLDNDVMQGILNFDFAKTLEMAFIHTMWNPPVTACG
jgi:hypothetical protein